MSDASGFQARNTPAERRAFFDVQRQITDLIARVDEQDAAIAVLETRVDDLESP